MENPCIAEASAALGRNLTADEADSIFTDVNNRVNEAKSSGGSFDDIIRKAQEKHLNEIKTAAFIQKRNAALSLKLRIEAIDYIKTMFPNNPEKGLEALIVGINSNKMGSRLSAASAQKTLADGWKTALNTDLIQKDVKNIFTSPDFNNDLGRALFSIGNPDAAKFSGTNEVMKTAESIKKIQKVMMNEANVSGSNISEMIGYIVRQSHDATKIKNAGQKQWVDDIFQELNFDKTFVGENGKKILEDMWVNLSEGNHIKTPDEISGFKGGTFNLGKRMSAERVLHFKDADAFLRYNEKYGTGSIAESVLRSIDVTAQNVGLMKVFGPNPMDNFNRISGYVEASLKGKQQVDFKKEVNGKLTRYMNQINGINRIPENDFLAKVGSNTRGFMSAVDLGSSVITSIQDLSSIMAEMHYQGYSMFDAFTEALDGLTKGRQESELADIYSSLGVYFESSLGDVHDRIGANDSRPGLMAKAVKLQNSLSGQTYWNERHGASVTLMMSHYAARNANLTFDKLAPELQRIYGLFGIDADKWDMFRATSTIAADGKNYLLPDKIKDLPKETFSNYLEKRGVTVNDTSISELKREVEFQWKNYFNDRRYYAMLEPDAKTQATLNFGLPPGSVLGEALRFVTQYKSFPVAFIQKQLGREFYGRGAETFAEALKNRNGEMEGFMKLFLTSTLFGYATIQMKSLLAGKSPRQPTDPEGWLKLIQASMVQGGGAGIYGDFLFGELKSRYGASPLETFMGPGVSRLGSLVDLYGKAKAGDDVAGNSLRFVINNTPFKNVWYTKMALDYGIVYHLQEMMNPGYLRRMEDRIKKEKDQSYLFPPSQVIK